MISFGFISLDVILILILIATLILLSYKKGKKNLVSLILAMYPALIVFNNLPFIKPDSSTSGAFIFIVIYIVLFVLARKYIHVKKNHTTSRKWVDSILLTASFVILFLSVYIYAVPALSSFYSFSSQIVDLIAILPYGVSILIPIVVLFIVNKKDLD